MLPLVGQVERLHSSNFNNNLISWVISGFECMNKFNRYVKREKNIVYLFFKRIRKSCHVEFIGLSEHQRKSCISSKVV